MLAPKSSSTSVPAATSPTATVTPRRYKVFISHSTKDKFMARMVDQALRDAGIDTFRDDRDIDGGDRIPDEIRTEIAKSDELVVVWTAQTLTSEWVKQEIGAAWGLGRRVVPLLHVVDPVTLPPSVKDAKAYPINDVDQYLKEVVARAKPTHV